MKSHLQLADSEEQSITFKTISYTTTKEALVVTLDGKEYTINKDKISQQQFNIKELTIFLDYLITKSKEYISITAPQDCVITMENW